ncbi:hypothetical protein H310_08129 [Aphanomyces invadans]|uniref:WRKY19-like zinc finger domain-containing protein n=1 Tax=Aphanomyces invadans TaxID=157072 RepID=A0A024U1H9_9STRA|nr:hypothetical protein H310_08129 [Aphanomyces invadans]ETV99437.1 hypothetical protein H310_08129 [Aphanomyces invadans]|eukprot:XP_008871993.1 hypothetical protein H310_08129 [Aphanomyces invadans]
MLAPETSLLPPPSPTTSSPPQSVPFVLSPSTCKFNSCEKPSVPGTDKCSFHKNRPHCSFTDCNNQVVSQRLCARHGGKKVCQFEGCTAHTRGRKFCLSHGGVVPKRFCSVEGCNKQAHSNQKCVRHGGGRYCKAVGCSFHARSGGFCRMHRSPLTTPAGSHPTNGTVAPSRDNPSQFSSSSDEDSEDRGNDTRQILPLKGANATALLMVNTHYLPREKPEIPYIRRPQVELKPRPPPATMMSLHLPPPLVPPSSSNVAIQPAPTTPSPSPHAPSDGLSFPPDRTLMSMANLVHAMTMAQPPAHPQVILPSTPTSLLQPEASSPTCKFNLCVNPTVAGSDKCSFHKNRTNCSFPDCTNQVVARNLCVRHGGRRLCQFEDCTAHRRGKRFCLKHGGEVPKRFCTVEGCQKQAHSNQRCVRHGGGRYCQSPGCSYHARTGGFCRNHASSGDVLDHDKIGHHEHPCHQHHPFDGLLMLQMCATGDVELGGVRVKEE